MKAWFDVVYIDRYLRNEVDSQGGQGLDPRVTSVPTIIDPRTNHVYRGTDAFLVVQYISKTIKDDPHTRTFNEKGTNDPNSTTKMLQSGGGGGGGGGGCDFEACDITSDKRAPPLAFATDSDALESFDQFDLEY